MAMSPATTDREHQKFRELGSKTVVAVIIEDADGNQITSFSKPNYSLKETVVGTIIYLARALPGSSQSNPVWQAMKVDGTTGIVVTWADGNSNFDNVATDLTTLSYS